MINDEMPNHGRMTNSQAGIRELVSSLPWVPRPKIFGIGHSVFMPLSPFTTAVNKMALSQARQGADWLSPDYLLFGP